LRITAFDATDVIRRQEHDGKAHIAVRLDLLNDGATLAGLFVQNDCLKPDSLEETGNGLPRTLIVTVDDKGLSSGRPVSYR